MSRYMKSAETAECRKNDDSEICIYYRIREYQTEWIPHFRPFNILAVYHNGERRFAWTVDSDDPEPKDEDKCPICGRIIIIYEV